MTLDRPATEPTSRRRAFVVSLLVPAVAVAIACTQMALAIFGPLTPWKGGGFGMFSTTDRPDNRRLNITAVDAGNSAFRVRLPMVDMAGSYALTSSFLSQTIAFPTEDRLRLVAEAVLRSDVRPVARPPSLPRILEGSQYAHYLDSGPAAFTRLEVVGPAQTAASPVLVEATATVTTPKFDSAKSTLTLRVVAQATAYASAAR